MTSLLESINARISVRSYSAEKIPEGPLNSLVSFMSAITEGPFGTKVRFLFLDESASSTEGLKKLGTYGMISGDMYYIAGAAEKGPWAEMDYGYCLERIILKATELGLGTCWLGGSLNRKTFSDKISLKDNEIIPSITPVGIPSNQTRLKIRIIQNVMQVRKRKEFGSIFFDAVPGTPLAKEGLGEWATVLEAVRSGPSASNKQPWRIIKNGNGFDFYLDFDPVYNSVFKEFSIQKIDIGIALCHFELSAKELKLPGSWKTKKEAPAAGKLMYITSWNYS